MRAKSKRVAAKGLELACFVADGLGRYPQETGAFAFDWQRVDDEDGEGSGGVAWNPMGDERVVEDDSEVRFWGCMRCRRCPCFSAEGASNPPFIRCFCSALEGGYPAKRMSPLLILDSYEEESFGHREASIHGCFEYLFAPA